MMVVQRNKIVRDTQLRQRLAQFRWLWRGFESIERTQRRADNPRASESAQEFMQRVARRDLQQCPCCTAGRLRVVETFSAQSWLPAPGAPAAAAPTTWPACRGPPS
ncbi:MAG: hypothetical protein ABI831_22270 [Betaproteobacteria bacterium]